MRKHDLVVSLIPYTFHAAVIKSAIREKKHVVTTSYVSPAMMALDADAKEAGITVLNEIGVSFLPIETSGLRLTTFTARPRHWYEFF